MWSLWATAGEGREREECAHVEELLAGNDIPVGTQRYCWNTRHRSLVRSPEQYGDTMTARVGDWKKLLFRKSPKTIVFGGMGGVVTFAGFKVSENLELTSLGLYFWIDYTSEGIPMRDNSCHRCARNTKLAGSSCLSCGWMNVPQTWILGYWSVPRHFTSSSPQQ